MSLKIFLYNNCIPQTASHPLSGLLKECEGTVLEGLSWGCYANAGHRRERGAGLAWEGGGDRVTEAWAGRRFYRL